MPKPTDIRCISATLYFLPVHTRIPLKFGHETVTYVSCARVCLKISDRNGKVSEGWGETPLSVQWVWPSRVPYEQRHEAMKQFCAALADAWSSFGEFGHPMEVGYDFQEQVLPGLLEKFNCAGQFQPAGASDFPVERADTGLESPVNRQAGKPALQPMPWLAALVCCSAFDIALHDAFGNLHNVPIYETYNAKWMSRSLDGFFAGDESAKMFVGKFPRDFLVADPPKKLPAWHLVGGLDPLDESELTGNEPHDNYPVMLKDWIQRDGLKCLKIKLRGNDAGWDLQRIVKVGDMSIASGVTSLSADFNCTVTEPGYVNEILDQLRAGHPEIFDMLLYVEQPFPYDLEKNQIDVHSVSKRKPLFLDESAHDWRVVKLGRELGWTGVALKTCKTQSGALLTVCWAKAHGMQLMVQDLTNPMLAQIPHVLLAANVGTIMGVETNAMQFYPDASAPEEKVHPGIYRRCDGVIDLSSIAGNGFGYQIEKIKRVLPGTTAT